MAFISQKMLTLRTASKNLDGEKREEQRELNSKFLKELTRNERERK